MSNNSFNLLGIRVHVVNIPEVLRQIDLVIKNKEKGYITVTGVHGIMESQRNDLIRAVHNHSFLTVPDGMPLVYIGRMKGHSAISRCYGPDLMKAVMKASVSGEYTHYFLGGNEGVANDLKKNMEKTYPGIKIVGTYTPPFRPMNKQEKNELIAILKELKPHIVWVGLSTPKQELFMREYLSLLDTNVMIGVGAAFDIHTGRLSSAPPLMQKLALEWLYRLIKEPSRLWRRYLINNPLFIWNFLLQHLNLKKF
jgi:N-acetylglucosaminyldiphosphoundecaprenol N-acetyl-beta-D-mannosaminyltransferase